MTLFYFQDKGALKSKEKELGKLEKDLESLRQKSEQDHEAHTQAQKHFHAVSAGLSSNQDGEDASLNDQLMGRLLQPITNKNYTLMI